jgi:hypothetical protein
MHYGPLLCCAILVAQLHAQPTDHLKATWTKLAKPLQSKYLEISFEENLNELYHTLEPWDETHFNGKGKIWLSVNVLHKSDTVVRRGSDKAFYTRLVIDDSTLLELPSWQKEPEPVTKSMFEERLLATVRYTPLLILNHLYEGKEQAWEDAGEFVVYNGKFHNTAVRLFIRKVDKMPAKISTLHHDDLHGDVTTNYIYDDFKTQKNGTIHPQKVRIEKINGHVKDDVNLKMGSLSEIRPQVLQKPADYKIEEDAVEKTELSTWKYNDRIHFIDLKHVSEQVMLVEFADFIFAAEAPLSSENGELIIQEAKRIAPKKPIRYFSFGHYHPHYTGGMRAFVHKRATVICRQSDEDYVKYLVAAPHTLQPDSLQLQPHPLKTEIIDAKKTITDGNFTVEIYFIGEKSAHTKDYLVYYIPSEKLLYVGDLVWIPKEGDIPKAGRTQAGLYNAIKDLGLEVTTIVQSWQTGGTRYKTTIPFAELERSMNVPEKSQPGN